ncbi:signal transduction histidine kinase [Ochrobactrum sp. RC6B]|nr:MULTISPECIES: ATP-binding protein [Brucella/Ochrobactrum group]MBB3217236.1 signal transduction histidine kinase [Ochrobactrum sp. RC6B]
MAQLKPDRSAIQSRGSNSNVIVSPDLLERAGVAHELGNLIQIAASALNIIARKAEADGHPVHGAAIDGARVSLDRASVLVRNAIRQAGRIETTVEPIDVKRSLAEIGDLIRDNWAPGHRVDIRFSESLPAVRCLCLELQSAILNLALNARDSMPEGGQIIIEANAVLQNNMQQIVEFRVSDSGIGMSPDTIRRAFDPFFTTKVSGLGGVGLALVKRFAEDAGGSVRLFSEAGAGTTVVLRLPGAK